MYTLNIHNSHVSLFLKAGEKNVSGQMSIFFKRFYLFIFTEGKGDRKERNINVWLPLMRPLLGT